MLIALLLLPALAQTTEMVPMRDGVRLATDVFLPEGEGPWPVILVRTPYSRDGAGVEGYPDAGVVGVAQDMRGRFDSEGVDMVFTTDRADGADTMAWILDQPWCDGHIATTGASALGIVQLVQAAGDPPGLVMASPHVATPDLYADAIFQGGVYRHSLIEGWLEGQGSEHFIDEIEAHPWGDDPFWDEVRTLDDAGSVHVSGLHQGGWYDIFAQGTLDAFTTWQEQGGEGARGEQKLIMGPWTHGGHGDQQQGELVYPEVAADSLHPFWEVWAGMAVEALELDLDVLDPDTVPAVQYFVMGAVGEEGAPGNQWRTADTWPPPAAPVRLYLHADGHLAESCPAEDLSDYVYDPEDPTPTLCGPNLNIPAGPCDQRAIEGRADNLIFSTGVLDEPLEITGRVRAHLAVSLDQPDTDLVVRISDVYPDGRSMLVVDGAARVAARGSEDGLELVEPGEVVEVEVDLWSTSIVIAPGHELRVAITSSSWPRFEPNRNTGLPFAEMRASEPVPVTVTLHHGAASWVELPDPSREIDDYLVCEAEESEDVEGCEGCASAPAAVGWLALLPVLGVRRRRSAAAST